MTGAVLLQSCSEGSSHDREAVPLSDKIEMETKESSEAVLLAELRLRCDFP